MTCECALGRVECGSVESLSVELDAKRFLERFLSREKMKNFFSRVSRVERVSEESPLATERSRENRKLECVEQMSSEKMCGETAGVGVSACRENTVDAKGVDANGMVKSLDNNLKGRDINGDNTLNNDLNNGPDNTLTLDKDSLLHLFLHARAAYRNEIIRPVVISSPGIHGEKKNFFFQCSVFQWSSTVYLRCFHSCSVCNLLV